MDDHQRPKQPQLELSGLNLPRRGSSAQRAATPQSAGANISKPATDRSRLANRLADIDRSLNIAANDEPPNTAFARAHMNGQQSAGEHPNLIAARAAIEKMAANEAAGVTSDDCVACSMLDEMDGPGACKPASVASATPRQAPSNQSAIPKPRTTKVSAANASPAQSPARSPTRAAEKQPRRARAFGIGLAGGAVIAVGMGMFGTTLLLESHNVTAAPHHAIPASIGFEFSLASSTDIYDGGPAWAWREAVTMRTIRDISTQRADTGSAWAASTQLSSLSRAGTVYPVASSVRPQAGATVKAPHHAASIEVLAKFETAAIPAVREQPLRIAVATLAPEPATRMPTVAPTESGHLLPLDNDKRQVAPLAAPQLLVPGQDITRAVQLANAASLPSVSKKKSSATPRVTHHLAPRLERAAALEPSNSATAVSVPSPRVHTGHHVLTKASPAADRPLKLIATSKQRPGSADEDGDDTSNTASVSQPLGKQTASRTSDSTGLSIGLAKKAMLLGAAKETPPVAKPPQAVSEAPKVKWYKAPMPSWAPFGNGDAN